jgi:hypothetical protein
MNDKLTELFNRDAARLEADVQAQGGWEALAVKDFIARWKPIMEGQTFPENMEITTKPIVYPTTL